MTPIHVRHLRKRFGAVRALDDVSLEVASGELFFLLGPSGCGKTTLLRCLAGFCVPDDGSVYFGQRDVTRVAPQRRNTAMVFQNYALWPHMTVEANVAFGLKVRRVPRAERRRRAAEILDLMHLGHCARRRPNQLSGGQQQRVALARALIVRPQCLLLDEPLSNLDAKLRLEMRGEIRRLCREFGLTAVYVTHDQKEALSVADRMAVMFDGRVAQVGSPDELYRRPRDAQVADFLGETNFLKAVALEPGRPVDAGAPAWGRFAAEIGELLAAAPTGLTPGASCTLSIRPEAIEVLPPDAPRSGGAEANYVDARVVDGVYLGEALQLTLTVGTARLRASVPQRAATAAWPQGAAAVCRIDPRDVVVLHH